MPRPATERPLSEMMTVVLRLRRQTEMSTKLDKRCKEKVIASLGVVLTELQRFDVPFKTRGAR